jgi:3(or 17)beta-hydroxysteroid dehydrogenase
MEGRKGRVEGKVVLITGGASGLGKADAMRLAQEGARIVLTDVDRPGGQEVAAACGGLFFEQDVGEESSWPGVIETVLDAHGRLDVLVNNAGVAPIGDIEGTTTEMWRKALHVSLDGTFFGCRYSIPALRRSRGASIINMSSTAALVGLSPYLAYSAAKGGIRSMTKSIAAWGAALDPPIRCNSIHPGSISTPMVHGALEELFGLKLMEAEDPEATRRELGIGEPADVANLVLFLASDESKHMTGSELVVDAGSTSTETRR